MNVGIVIAICSVLVAAIPIYFLARSNARENERQKQNAIDKAVRDALEPVVRDLTDEKATNVRLQARVNDLQDKLYGRNR